MAPKDIQTHLMGLIRKSHRLELEYLNSLSDGARTANGTFEEWAAKDRISHNTYWRRRCIETLSYLSRDQNPPEYPTYEECNRQNFDETRELSVQALLRESDQVITAIPMALERFSEEDFRKQGFHPSLKTNTLLWYTLHNCYQHPLYHISEAYLQLGSLKRMNEVQDLLVEDVAGIDNSPYVLGTVLYDRACFYAMVGAVDQALELLQKSINYRPDVAAWASEDPDLVSLHEDTRFQQMIVNGESPAAS